MRIAAVFPGQGSQHTSMGKEVYKRFPGVYPLWEEAEDVFGISLRRIAFDGDEETLRLHAQPCIFLVSLTYWYALGEEGIGAEHFYAMAGHSLGEYTALCASGTLSFKDTLFLLQKRCQYMKEAPRGGMMAILGKSLEEVEGLLKVYPMVEIANHNTPAQYVVSGPKDCLEALGVQLGKAGRMLQVSGPFHSSYMTSCAEQFKPCLATVQWKTPSCEILSNTSPLPTKNTKCLKENLERHMSTGVKWVETQENLAKIGIQSLVEIGPGKVLAGLWKKTISYIPVHSLYNGETLWQWASDTIKKTPFESSF